MDAPSTTSREGSKPTKSGDWRAWATAWPMLYGLVESDFSGPEGTPPCASLLLSLLALGSLSALGIACSAAPAEDGDGSEDALETTNIGARHFGLEEGELVLTLDDGPGPRTKELVDFLVANQVPAILFQVGKNSERDPASSAYIAANSARVPAGLIVANHSNTHTDPLPKQGVSGSINDFNMTADRHLLPHIKASQSQFASPIKFFSAALRRLHGPRCSQHSAGQQRRRQRLRRPGSSGDWRRTQGRLLRRLGLLGQKRRFRRRLRERLRRRSAGSQEGHRALPRRPRRPSTC